MNLFFFFFNDTATTEIYTLSLHDALPISTVAACHVTTRSQARKRPAGRRSSSFFRQHEHVVCAVLHLLARDLAQSLDRKSTRLNSSHSQISYAVFCLKKKNSAILPNVSLTGLKASGKCTMTLYLTNPPVSLTTLRTRAAFLPETPQCIYRCVACHADH